jgi:hypothetical protein
MVLQQRQEVAYGKRGKLRNPFSPNTLPRFPQARLLLRVRPKPPAKQLERDPAIGLGTQ